MSPPQYSLTWDSFKSNVCNGFSALQQNGEFVDMTLAADGHFVKAHQVLVALSSTYLKNLMASAPCQHPVIFLNNISHKVLCYLLEYIYTGEVLVPSDHLPKFTEAAKSLQIKGLEGITNLNSQFKGSNAITLSSDNYEMGQFSHLKRKVGDEFDQISLQRSAKGVSVKSEAAHITGNQIDIEPCDESHDFSNDMMSEPDVDHSEDYKQDASIGQSVDIDQVKTNPSNILYTLSVRGSIQTILNRYIYNLTSTIPRTGIRRWRCVDYRNNKCNAVVVTKGNLVINRSHLHNHPFHDQKILSKIEKKAVFSAIDDVEAYREKEKSMQNADTIDDDDYTLEQLKSVKNG